jgi:glycine cleavage system H protein
LVRIGITDYAQDALGDIVFIDLPEQGRSVTKGDTLAEVESTKSVAEVYAPLSGTVAAVNGELAEHPELVNQSPYDEGWFVDLEPADGAEYEGLLEPETYRAHTENG